MVGRPQYYETLNAAQRANDSSKFIEFTLSAILDTINEQASQEGRHRDEHINEPISEHINNPVLEALRENPRATNAEIAEATGLSRATITRHFQRLKADGVIERVGSNKTGHWKILE